MRTLLQFYAFLIFNIERLILVKGVSHPVLTMKNIFYEMSNRPKRTKINDELELPIKANTLEFRIR